MIWPGIGGIGQDLLVAGHGGVEADLADRGAGGAEAESFQHRAVGEHEQGRGLGLGPGGFVLFGGHVRVYIVADSAAVKEADLWIGLRPSDCLR